MELEKPIQFNDDIKDLTKGEKVHIRLIGESFSVTEQLNHLPIIPKTEAPSRFGGSHDLFNTTIDYDTQEIKKWRINKEELHDDYSTNRDFVTIKNKTTKQLDGKPEIWIGRHMKSPTKEDFLAHFNILTSSIILHRTMFVFSETDKHYKLVSYQHAKTRMCGFRYFKIKRHISSIILNKHTGDFYLRTAIFNNRKWKINLKKNYVHGLIVEMFKYISCLYDNKSNGIGVLGTDNGELIETRFDQQHQVILSYECINKIVSVLGIDLTRYYYAPYPFNKKQRKSDAASVPSGEHTIAMTVILWFLQKKGIKYANNPFGLLSEHYPKIKLLRKHDMNLIHAALSSFGMKSRSTIKLFNTHPEISCFNVFIWYHLLGAHYFTQLNPDLLTQPNRIVHVLVDRLGLFGIVVEKITDVINNPAIWKQLNLILTKDEKYHFLCILRSIDPEEDDMLTLNEVADHLRFKNELAEFNDVVRINAKTHEQFIAEHYQWTNRLHHYKKDKIIRYNYSQPFIEKIEQPQIISNGSDVYYPVILKEDSEYMLESEIQHNCVKSYVDRYNSIIISMRKRDKLNLERVTCEYKYDKDLNIFKVVQKKGHSNITPKEHFEPALLKLDQILNEFAKECQYKKPTVIELNKRSGVERIVSEETRIDNNNVLVENDAEDVDFFNI